MRTVDPVENDVVKWAEFRRNSASLAVFSTLAFDKELHLIQVVVRY